MQSSILMSTMSAKEAKESREEKLIKLQLTISVTRKTVESDSPNTRTLGRKLGELKAAWNEFQEVHVRYLLKEKREDEKNAVNEQYENLIGTIDYILDTGEDKLEKLSIASENSTVSTINNQRDIIQANLGLECPDQAKRDDCLGVTEDVKLEHFKSASENPKVSIIDDKHKDSLVDIGNEKQENLNIAAKNPTVSIIDDHPKAVVHTSSLLRNSQSLECTSTLDSSPPTSSSTSLLHSYESHSCSPSTIHSSQLVSYSLSPVHSSQSPTCSSSNDSSQLVSYSPSPPHTPQAIVDSQTSLLHYPKTQMYSPKSFTCVATHLQSPKSSSPVRYLQLIPFGQLSAYSPQTFIRSPPLSHPPQILTSSSSLGTSPQMINYSSSSHSHSPQSTIYSPSSPTCSPEPSDCSPSLVQSPQTPTRFTSPVHDPQTRTCSPSFSGSPPAVPLSPTPFQLNLFSQDSKWLLPRDKCNSNHRGSEIKSEDNFPLHATDLPENVGNRKRKRDFAEFLEEKTHQNKVRSAKFNSEQQSESLSQKWQKDSTKDIIETKKEKTKYSTDNELHKLLSVGSAFRNGKKFYCFHCQYEGKDVDHFTSRVHQTHMKDCKAKILDCPENEELSAEINKLRSNWELLSLPNWKWRVDKKSPYHGYYCLHCKEPFTDMRHIRGKKHLTHMSESRCDSTCKMVKSVNTSVKGSKFCIICDVNLGTLKKVYQSHVKGSLHSKSISRLLRK